MNKLYKIINRKLKDTDKNKFLTFGKLSYFLETTKESEDIKDSIMRAFSKQGLGRDEYISDKYVIRKAEITRKPKIG